MGRLPERDTKISARALGIAMTQDKVTKCKKAKQAAEVEASTAKSGILCNDWIEKAVKGRFGKQVTAAFSKKPNVSKFLNTVNLGGCELAV